ncbi:hypothetical protein ACA910_022702 [Epithemia clementina (nom. ined.)]
MSSSVSPPTTTSSSSSSSSSSSAPTAPPLLILKSVTIPVVLVAITSFQLRTHLSQFADFFFAVDLADQACLLTLLFAVLFGVLSLALALLTDPTSSSTTINSTHKEGGDEEAASKTAAHTTNNDFFATLESSQEDDKKKKMEYPLEALSNATTDKERLECLYPQLRDELLSHMKECNEMNPEALDWCKEMMDYNVPGGKLNRGTTVLAVLRTLKQQLDKDADLTPLEMAQAAVCGWSLEFLQAFFLVADDVMDDSKTRRGQPCWFRLPKVGLIAINDSFLLESFVFGILKRHFSNTPYYAALVDLIINVIQKTELGQLLDLTSQSADGKTDFTRFTMERYNLIVKYKTAFYSFYLPTAMGMILYGMRDAKAYAIAQDICCQMGEYFQIQDDYLDCFGDPAVIGKIGTDIQENKCSWLVVQALLACPDDSNDSRVKNRRKVLEQNYGQWNDGKVAKVKAVYKELDLPQLFANYEEESYAKIQKEVERVADMVPKDVFEVLLKKIYKRSK